MKIRLYAAGVAVNNGKPTAKGGCAVMMEVDDDYGRSANRSLTQPVGNSTTPRADINAARIALASVVRKYRKSADVRIYVSQFVYRLLAIDTATGAHYANPNKNIEEVNDLRRWASYYTKLSIFCAERSDLADVLNLAKACADTQTPTDSRTRMT